MECVLKNKLFILNWLFTKFSFIFYRFPIDWRDPFGYLIAFIAQTGTMFGFLVACSPALCLFIGFCWLSMAFVADIEDKVSQWNESNEQKESLTKIYKQLSKIIQFHTDAKELSTNGKKLVSLIVQLIVILLFRLVYDFSDIYRFQLCSYYVWSVSTICSNLLSIQTGLVEYFFLTIIIKHQSIVYFFSFFRLIAMEATLEWSIR